MKYLPMSRPYRGSKAFSVKNYFGDDIGLHVVIEPFYDVASRHHEVLLQHRRLYLDMQGLVFDEHLAGIFADALSENIFPRLNQPVLAERRFQSLASEELHDDVADLLCVLASHILTPLIQSQPHCCRLCVLGLL